MLDAACQAKLTLHLATCFFFKIPFVDWDGKGKNRNRSNAMTWTIHPLGNSIQKKMFLDLIGQHTLLKEEVRCDVPGYKSQLPKLLQILAAMPNLL